MQSEEISDEEFREWVAQIQEQSPYRCRQTQQKNEKKYMSVHEMGDLLGLKKTDRYWLVHKGFFQTDETPIGMRVDIESFEEWYANQVKYRKVTGEEPGLELKKHSYSARDIAQLLDIKEWQVYEEMKKADLEFIRVDYWKRWPVEVFEEWYRNQTKYKKKEHRDPDLEAAVMRMPEMARLLGVPRGTVYNILDSNPQIQTVVIGNRRHVVKASFYVWYRNQDHYHLAGEEVPAAISEETNPDIELHRREVLETTGSAKNIGNDENLTLQEAALLADVTPAAVSKWVRSGRIHSVKFGKAIRIPRKAFEAWLQKQR